MWLNYALGVAGGFAWEFGIYAWLTREDWLSDPYAIFDWDEAFSAGIDGAIGGLAVGGVIKGGSIIKGMLK